MKEPLLGNNRGQDEVFSAGDTVELYRLQGNINENGMHGTIEEFLPRECLYKIIFEVCDRAENIKLVDTNCFHVGAKVQLHDNIGQIIRYLEDEELHVRPENIKLVRKL